MAYNQLTLQERYYIEVEIKNGTSQKQIAKALGRSQGTISKEIARNKGERGYRHKQADRTAKQRHQEKEKSIKLTEDIKEFIEEKLKANQSSPEQIAGRIKRVLGVSLHHETIYRYILQDKADGGELYLHLRHKSDKNPISR